ncbi:MULTISPECIES: VOC family protein [Citrobacter]|jgi:catechol 2,3-dioxygenase-like lactoylglutathione lyase family enzyme|uniref:VOC family protein n=1 Tax=Citrobacter TaxID=544 RepID=UPI000CDE1C99|nr:MULTISPECIES: VOC family protein [Citrobacter]MBJ8896269.1 VOC family protein [Citrobacter braakii]MDU2945092.1 VOC family protein [Citrobacter sp.]MEB2303627.1 VOC family protein [Citrobacter braakii]POT33355.1 VOC family virulence protein [Citrobacter braakii]POT38184.1 VOC family virulence protein [Citrobacter braakii]
MDIAMIDHLDHLVLTSNNEEACVHFYVELLGMRLETFAQGRKAFVFGNQKINLHIRGKEFEPKAHAPTPGALDLCFITTRALEEVIATFQTHGVDIVEGPVARTGAMGPIRSVYVRDPDLNLIEIAVYPADDRT